MEDKSIVLRNLIRKCKQNDMSAFDRLMNEFQSSVFGYAYKLSKNYEDANDITNETFVRVLDAIKSFQEGSHFKGWLLTIVKSVYLDRYRAEKKHQHLSLEGGDESGIEIKDDSPGPDITLLDEEKKNILNDMINALPEIHRQPLLLFYISGKSYKEISRELGISMGTVKSRISRGVDSLRNRYLEEYEEKKLPKGNQKRLPSPHKN